MSKLDVNTINFGVTDISTTRGGQSKTDIEVISRTLDAYGRKNNIKYVFVDSIKSAEGKSANGTYAAGDNVVYLSVNSRNPLSVAAGHETFHFMKQNNSKAGQELQEYVINKLKSDSSYDYDARVEELSKLYGTDDTDAINEEIAANAMFDIFDEATVKDLAKNHKKLFETVKEKLGEVLEYFKNAVKKYADFLGNKEARSNLRNDYEALQSIRDRMDKALEEIKNGESEKMESAVGGEKYNIEYGMSDEEREKELRKMTLAVVEYDKSKSNFSSDEIKNLKKKHLSEASSTLKSLVEKFNIADKRYSNKYIHMTFKYTKAANKESMNKQSKSDKDYVRFAKMLSIFDELVQSAVPIEIHSDRYAGTVKENRQLKYDYVLLSGFKDGNSFVPVAFHIKQYATIGDNPNRLYVSITLGEIKKESELRANPRLVNNYDSLKPARSLPLYSLTNIIRNVNPKFKGFLMYVPDGMLTDEQIKSKKKALMARKNYIENLSSKSSSKKNAEKFSLDEEYKERQFNIIERENPAPNSYLTWVRSVEDILTLSETLTLDDYFGEESFDPDLSIEDIKNAIETGRVTVYSSYPIENGVFVSPSRMEAESYSGNGMVYERNTDIKNIAWIDPTQGMYAEISEEQNAEDKKVEFSEKFSLDENEDVVNKYNQILAENKHLRELNAILREEMQKTPNDRVVVITDIDTKSGEMILPIHVNSKGKYAEVDLGVVSGNFNLVSSAYGRKTKFLIEDAIKNDGVLFQNSDKKRVETLLARNGVQFPTPLKLSDSIINISENRENVNREFSEKFSLDENEDVVNKYNQVLAENKYLREMNDVLKSEMRKTPKDKIGKKGDKACSAGHFLTIQWCNSY